VWGEGVTANGLPAFHERAGEAGRLHLEHGHELMKYLVGKKAMHG